MESEMNDPKKSAEAVKKIQEIQKTIASHQTTIARIEHEKGDRIKQIENEKGGIIRNFDQQIKNEQDRIKQYALQIEVLKHQI
jgi:phage host-nuclease inhibitor protein Gam